MPARETDWSKCPRSELLRREFLRCGGVVAAGSAWGTWRMMSAAAWSAASVSGAAAWLGAAGASANEVEFDGTENPRDDMDHAVREPLPRDLTVRRMASDRFELAFAPPEPRPLRLLQITDTHFGNPDPHYRTRDERTRSTIEKLIAASRPDLVAHTGDFVNNDRGADVVWDALDWMDGLGLPWVHTLGNHDIGHRPVEDIRQQMRNGILGYFDMDGRREYAYRLDVRLAAPAARASGAAHGADVNGAHANRAATAGAAHGASAAHGTDAAHDRLTGSAPAPASGEPAWSLFCFDSGYQRDGKHVPPAQLEWFRAQLAAEGSRADRPADAVVLVHIPVVEFEQLRAAGRFAGICGEGVCFETDAGRTFDALRQSSRIRAVFCGHDHENDYAGTWNDIELVYGRVTGWSGYGQLERGGRLIEIDPWNRRYRHRLLLVAG